MKKLITLLLVLTGMVSTANAWNYLKGTFNSWNASADYCLDNGPVAVYLTADTYEFGIDNSGTWKGPNGNATVSATTTINSFSGSGNFQLTVTTAGYYVFSTNWDNGLSLTVRYPDTWVYFYNALGWSNVYMHDGWWNGDKGACNKNALRGIAMTEGENNIYSAYIPKASLTRVTFTSDKQVNDGDGQYGAGYDNFYATEVVWNADGFDANKPLYAPTEGATSLNNCSYYYGGAWHAYPSYTRSVTSGNFGTICLPFAATVTGATVYEIKNKVMDGSTLTGINLKAVDKLVAGYAYIFKATSSTLTATLEGDPVTTATEANGMMGNLGSTIQAPIGSYVIGDNEIHEVTGNAVNVGQYKAYITLEGIAEVYSSSSREANFIAFENGDATGVSQIEDVELNNENYFDLQGRRVAQPTKGLYIVNGKKVIIK